MSHSLFLHVMLFLFDEITQEEESQVLCATLALKALMSLTNQGYFHSFVLFVFSVEEGA